MFITEDVLVGVGAMDIDVCVRVGVVETVVGDPVSVNVGLSLKEVVGL